MAGGILMIKNVAEASKFFTLIQFLEERHAVLYGCCKIKFDFFWLLM